MKWIKLYNINIYIQYLKHTIRKKGRSLCWLLNLEKLHQNLCLILSHIIEPALHFILRIREIKVQTLENILVDRPLFLVGSFNYIEWIFTKAILVLVFKSLDCWPVWIFREQDGGLKALYQFGNFVSNDVNSFLHCVAHLYLFKFIIYHKILNNL